MADYVKEYNGMDKFVDSLPKDIIQRISDCSLVNSYTESVQELEMPVTKNTITYGSDYTVLSQDSMKTQINE